MRGPGPGPAPGVCWAGQQAQHTSLSWCGGPLWPACLGLACPCPLLGCDFGKQRALRGFDDRYREPGGAGELTDTLTRDPRSLGNLSIPSHRREQRPVKTCEELSFLTGLKAGHGDIAAHLDDGRVGSRRRDSRPSGTPPTRG